MNFPPVPPNEPLGPSRRIGGTYTLAKNLTLAPVQVEQDRLEETLIMGKDGGVYKGTEVPETRQESSSQGFVEPTVVTLQINNKLPSNIRDQTSIVKLPILNIEKIKELMKSHNTEKRVKMKESEDETADIMDEEFKQIPQSKDKENEIEAITDVEELEQTTPQAEDEESKTEVIKDVEELKETTPHAENEESETKAIADIEEWKQTAEESEDSDTTSTTEETEESKDSD